MRGSYGIPALNGYNAFTGPGGSGAEVDGAALLIETWNDYSVGTWTFPQAKWSKANSLSTLDIIADGAYSKMTDQHLRTTATSVDSSTPLLYTLEGSTMADGVIGCQIVADISGHANCQPTIMGRYVDSANRVEVRVIPNTNQLQLAYIISAVGTTVTQGVNLSLDKLYYVELILDGANIQAKLYDGPDTTTLLTSVSNTTPLTSSGSVGVRGIGQGTAKAHFDNFNPVPA